MSTIASAGEKPLNWPNLTAPVNLRSNPDAVPWGQWRKTVNVRAIEKGRLARREGWRRFGYQTNHPNCDLHDLHGGVASHFSGHVHPGSGTPGARLFIGTQSDIWMNRTDGGWKNVASGHSGGAWSFASNGSLCVTANGKTVLWNRVGSNDAFATIPSLALIGVTSAKVVFAFQGVFFLSDLVIDGVSVRNRIVYADQNSIDFDLSSGSTAGTYDLNPDERILYAGLLGTVLMLFTTHGFWRVGVQDGVFVFQNVYYSKDRVGCLQNPNAIAIDRAIAYYVASDGIYTVTPFSSAPEWSDWINDGLPSTFLSDTDACLVDAACYDPKRNEILFSSQAAGLTYWINTRVGSSGLIDHAFLLLMPASLDRSVDFAQWWVRDGICTPEAVDDFWSVGPRDDVRIYPTPARTATECDPFDSWPACDDCRASMEVIGVSAADKALKFFDEEFYGRERRTSTDWVVDSYGCQLLTGSLSFSAQEWKRISRSIVEFIATPTDEPGVASLRVGVSASPVDPAAPSCVRVWTFSYRTLLCRLDGADQPNTQPANWVFEVEGRYVYFDIRVEPTVGAPVTFTRFAAFVSISANTTP